MTGIPFSRQPFRSSAVLGTILSPRSHLSAPVTKSLSISTTRTAYLQDIFITSRYVYLGEYTYNMTRAKNYHTLHNKNIFDTILQEILNTAGSNMTGAERRTKITEILTPLTGACIFIR